MSAHFDQLLTCAGAWAGIYKIQVVPSDPVKESPTQVTARPILKATFLRIDQTWLWEEQLQEGSLLIGFNRSTGDATVHWADTWHNGTTVMPLKGGFDGAGKLTAHGHFAVKDSPDWGWRIEIAATADRLKIDMYCVNPDGNRDEGGVWAEYQRVK